MLRYHDHLTIGRIGPHVEPIDSPLPQLKNYKRAEADVQVINNLQPATLYGADGHLFVEPGISNKSESDAVSRANLQLKQQEILPENLRHSLQPQEQTSFTMIGFITDDELQRLLDKKAVLYVVGVIVFGDKTGIYEQPICNAITVRQLPEGKTTSQGWKCNIHDEEIERDPKKKTLR